MHNNLFFNKNLFRFSRLPLMRELPSVSEAEGEKSIDTTPQSPAAPAPLTRGARSAGRINFWSLGFLC